MKEYIQENKERFFQELFSLLRIPSVSAKPEHKQDMYRCADRLVELLKEAGADEAAVYEPETAIHVLLGAYFVHLLIRAAYLTVRYKPAILESFNGGGTSSR